MTMTPTTDDLTCCDKTFANKTTLCTHLKKIHGFTDADCNQD